uniref:BTB domain-containing protein n=1 Tax=Strigamia maritima TaxID=126957 RepID=T1IXC3_STRMM
MGSQQFCLRWNNHQMNMLNVFESLLQNEVLVDVTLACDGLTLKAHKVVLSACSPYFQTLFMDNPCKHPIVFLKDVRYCDLKALIDFMYKGEVNVGQDQLTALLNTAESLKIKGLAEVAGGNGGAFCTNSNTETQIHPMSRVHMSSSGNGTSTDAQSPQHRHGGHHSVTVDKMPSVTSLLQPSNALSIRGYGHSMSTSPPPKRRKTKPRKRIPESALICSDPEDSDALDLATTTPEMIESCVDLPPADNTLSETSETNVEDVKPNISILEMANQSQMHSYHHYEQQQIGEENHPSPENKQSYSSNQNQFSVSVPKPPIVPTQQRLGAILPKPPLLSVIPSSAVSPVPSTSAPEATIQDPAGWPERKKREYHCEHCQASFDSKKVFYKHGCPRVRVGFTCDVCGSFFPTHCRYSRHRQIHNPDREIYTCYYCPKTMVRMDHLKQHMKTAHGLGYFAPDEFIYSSSNVRQQQRETSSTTEANIRRLCHFTRQSQKHKSPWTEEDMVSALEAVQRGRLTYALAARKFDIPKATLHYYVILMKAVEAVRSGRMTPEIAAIKYNVRNSVLNGCLYGTSGDQTSRNSSPPPQPPSQPLMLALDRNDVVRRDH